MKSLAPVNENLSKKFAMKKEKQFPHNELDQPLQKEYPFQRAHPFPKEKSRTGDRPEQKQNNSRALTLKIM